VKGNQARNVTEARNEGNGEEENGGYPRQIDGDQVDVGGVVESRNLIPQSVEPEPEPRLAGVAAGLVHDAPLGTVEMVGERLVRKMLPVFEEQEWFGEVRSVEGLIGDEIGVRGSPAGQNQLSGD
jgi:hypothetical protein